MAGWAKVTPAEYLTQGEPYTEQNQIQHPKTRWHPDGPMRGVPGA
jgi:hypothetical protein